MEKISTDPNGRDGIASLIQVSASSTMESDYLYGEEPVALFNTRYEQHTPFDKEPSEVFNSKGIVGINTTDHPITSDTCVFGNNLIFNMDASKSECMGNLILMITLPDITRYGLRWTNDIGYAMIESVKIVNGGEELLKYTGEYLHIRSNLNTSSCKRNGINSMTGHYNTAYSLNGASRVLFVPIPFMENLLDKQYFPIFLTDSSTFQIYVNIRPIRDVIYIPPNNEITCIFTVSNSINVQFNTKSLISFDGDVEPRFKARLLYDAFYISQPERILFSNKSGELLFQYVQERTMKMERGVKSVNMQLDFNNTISHLIITVSPDCAMDRNLHFSYVPLHTIKLILDGVVVNKSHQTDDKISASKFRYIQPNANIPSKWIYVIPFCLSCTQTQPSGFYTMSGTQRNLITFDRNTYVDMNCTITVYAVTYNSLYFDNRTISML